MSARRSTAALLSLLLALTALVALPAAADPTGGAPVVVN
jgi:hypothetical protein